MRYAPKKGSGNESGTEADEACAEARGAIFRRMAQTQDAGDACSERAAICGEAERGCAAPFFHGGEGAGVAEMIAASGDGDIVAAVFTFGAHALVQPPNRRMEKEKRFRDDLEKIDERIEAANVSEFMRDNGFDLIFGESHQCANGKKNDGAKPSDYGGSIEPTAFAETNDALQTETSLEFAALGEELGRDGDGSGAAETF